MKRPHDEPAFPAQQDQHPDGSWNHSFEWGLTKREILAGMAMQGMLANSAIAEASAEIKATMSDAEAAHLDAIILPRATALASIAYADALLDALHPQPEAELPKHEEVK